VLLEGVPGLAKTLAIRTLSQAIDADFARVQFTPDLLPADITGTMIYQQKSEQFTVKKGPVFANFVLADEINRAPAKVQSALLEAMQERQITIGDTSYKLPSPFLVMATQNPIEQEGTYPLPEAQVDRFMLKVALGYPSRQEEQLILRSNVRAEGLATVSACISQEDILKGKQLARAVYLDEKIERYIVDIVSASRNPSAAGLSELSHYIAYGGSPRATINLALAAKAHAFLERRAFVIPEDVRAVSLDVLRHRIGLTYEAEADSMRSETLIEKLIQRVEVP
jgi:MoxR-like ATPase